MKTRLLAALVLLGAALACDSWLTKPARYNTIDVTAVRRNGDPIPGVNVELYTGQRPMGYGVTDAKGHYLFPLVPDGLYGVRAVQPSDYAPVEELTAGPPTTAVSGINIKGQEEASAQFTFLKRGPGTVSASVADDVGAPMTGMYVTLYRPSGSVDSARTDATGVATFTAVPFGNYGVSVPRTAPYRDFNESSFATKDGLIVEEGATANAAITLARCNGTIRVTTRDNTGAVAPNVAVSLYTGAGVVQDATTDATGVRTFTPICGDYGVRVPPQLGWTIVEGRGTSFVDGLHVSRGASLSASFSLTRCTGSVTATVRDENNVGVADYPITLYISTGVVADATTGANGTYTFTSVGCGNYGVRLNPRAGFSFTTGFVDGLVVTNLANVSVALLVRHN